MKARLVGGLCWAASVTTAVFACAADPGDDAKDAKNDGVAPGVGAPGDVDGSGRTVSADSSTIGNVAPPMDDGMPAAEAMPTEAATSVEASTPAEADAPPSPSCATCPLTVQYFTRDSSPTGQTIAFDLSISNRGATPQPLSELTVRYWFTAEGATAFTMHEYYAANPINGNVTGTFSALAPATMTADTFLQIAFGTAAGTIPAMGSTNDIQMAFNEANYKTTFNEANDYSYIPSDTMASCAAPNNAVTCPSTMVTLYRNGTLVWGTEPRSATSTGGDR